MEMVINGRETKVLSCQVVYERYDGKVFYVVVAAIRNFFHRIEYEPLLITEDSEEAWNKCCIVREAIEADKKGTAEVD